MFLQQKSFLLRGSTARPYGGYFSWPNLSNARKDFFRVYSTLKKKIFKNTRYPLKNRVRAHRRAKNLDFGLNSDFPSAISALTSNRMTFLDSIFFLDLVMIEGPTEVFSLHFINEGARTP